MESTTKNRQSLDMLRAMVLRAYGRRLTPENDDFASELSHGWFNIAYRVTLTDGRAVVLKISPPPDVPVMTYEHEMMRTEIVAAQLLKKRTTVPVPEIEYADTSRELLDADWFFMPFVEGANLGILLEERTVAHRDARLHMAELGKMNREINSIVGNHFGPLRGPGYKTWREAFTGMIHQVIVDGERAQLEIGWDYDVIRRVIVAEQDSLDEVVEPRFVEWDLWVSNVIVRGGQIVGILDHERALYGDPLLEAGFTAIDLPGIGYFTEFASGYGLSPLSKGERRRRRLYTLYLMLVMVIETHYRGHEEATQYNWARERLTEVMALYGLTP